MNRILLIVASAIGIGLAAPAMAQKAEYATRGRMPVNAISFGSNPFRASLPSAYIRVNNSPHAVRFGAQPFRASLPRPFIIATSTGHVVKPEGGTTTPPAATQADAPAAPTRNAKRSRGRTEQSTANDKPVRPKPSRYALQIYAMMQNNLDCHP